MGIKGLRKDSSIRFMEKKINPSALIGGVIIGSMSILSDMIKCLTSGTGLLLCVQTIYELYDKVQKQQKRMKKMM